MEPFAKANQGIVAILAVEFGKGFHHIREVAESPGIANVAEDGIREIEAIVAKMHGIMLPFPAPHIAVWEGYESAARDAADAARAMIHARGTVEKDAVPHASTLPLLRIGAAYGHCLLQRDAKGRIANLPGELLKTSQSLCRKARQAKLTLLATDEFVVASGLPGFTLFEHGIQTLQ